MLYTVWYTGEYDLDEYGNAYPSHEVFDSLDAATDALEEYERRTGCLGSITTDR